MGYFAQGSVNSGGHYFYTGDAAAGSQTERMRIDTSGNLLVGTTTASANGRLIVLMPSATNGTGIVIRAQNVGGGTSQTSLVFENPDTTINSQIISDNGTGYLAFNQAGAERMRLDSSGNLLVGTTSAGGKLTVSNATADSYTTQLIHTASGTGASGPYGLFINYAGGTPNNTGNDFISCRDVTAYRMVVRSNGNLLNTNNSYGSLSDIKLKENIVDTSPKLNKLNQVRIVNYNLKQTPSNKHIGVIAQELELIFPSLVENAEDKETVTKTRIVEIPAVDEVLDEEGNVVTPAVEATTKTEEYTEEVLTGETTKSVKYSVFVPILIKAMQEQQAMIDELKAKVAALEAA